jgi:hypothetical protein
MASLGTVSGCADNESMLFIRGAMSMESGSCDFTADESAALLTSGTYDVAFGQAYYGDLLVGNQLASQGDKTRSRSETSSVTLEGAEVRLMNPDDSVLRSTFTSPGAGFIEVGSGEDTGYGGISVVVVPASSGADAVAAEMVGSYLIAEIRVFGKTLGGQEVESGIFKFPITVCEGCLVRFPATAMSPDGTCEGSEDAEASQPCRLGQDDVVSCAACAGNYAVCKEP